MVAIITGEGVGLERSSAWVLGWRGKLGQETLGRSGENVYVNAASGNLVISRQDEFLLGKGPDIAITRTYNSQLALGDGDNNDQWQASVYRRIVGASGSATVKRIDWDGSDTVYTQIGANLYETKDGPGPHDQLSWTGTQWLWTDGASRRTDTYDSTGKLIGTSDTDGNNLTYTYTGNLITRVTSTNGADPDETTDLVYNLGTSQLQHLVTTAGGTLTRIFYEYDGLGRLSVVKVNLTPTDNSKTTGANYETTYTYDGTSKRIASIAQKDGSLVSFTYVQVGADYKVATYTQTVSAGVTRTTAFDYSLTDRTTVTDPAGQKTTLFYDGKKNLSQISYPADDPYAAPKLARFLYDLDGNVASITLGPGNVVTYAYDTKGNLLSERDSAGNTVTRTYGAKNELLTETKYLIPDPDGAGAQQPGTPLTTRFAYDVENHLRYVVSVEGFVTQHNYDAAGLRTSTVEFTANSYTTAGAIDEGLLNTWVSGIADKSTTRRTEMLYNHRGAVTTMTSWSKVLASGAFDTASERSQTNYFYDQAGNLLNRTVTGSAGSEVFTYDGLNRRVTATDFNAALTRTTFLDSLGQTVLTHANGLSEVSTFNRGGELISFSRSSAGGNLVDSTGWPTNPDNVPSGQATVPGWMNASGHTDETQWASTIGPDGLPVVAMRAGQLDTSLEGGGNHTHEITIDATKAYEFTWQFKLSAMDKHYVFFGLSGAGPAYVENLHDGADNTNPYFWYAIPGSQDTYLDPDKWYKVVGYVLPQGTPTSSTPLGGVYDVATGQKVLDLHVNFRWNPEKPGSTVHSRFFTYYGEQHQQYSTYFMAPEVREVSASGLLGPDAATSLYRYDSLGRLRMTVDPTGRRNYFLYDSTGRKIADVDSDGSLSEYRYDGSGNITSITRYAEKLDANDLAALADFDSGGSAPVSNPTGSNLLTNGSFDTPGTGGSTLAHGLSSTSLTGWAKANGQHFEQVLAGQFSVTGTDGAYWLDMDSVAGSGAVLTTGPNLLTNGSFDTPGTGGSALAHGLSSTSLTGWNKVNAEAFEQVTAGQLGVTGTDGGYWLDLESVPGTGYFPTGGNLLTNGGFEQSGVYTEIATGRSNTSLPGWTKTNSETFEQVYAESSPIAGMEGVYWLDLDSVPGSGGQIAGPNLIVNGSFEQSATSYTTTGTGRVNSNALNIPGWTKTNALGFEQLNSGVNGTAATHGSFYLDMESTGEAGSRMDISQVVGGLTAGQQMTLKFDFANTAGMVWAGEEYENSGALEVYWNGALVALIGSQNTTMVAKAYTVTTVAGNNTLRFREIGITDGKGVSIDNVQLYGMVPAPNGGNMDIRQVVPGLTAGQMMQLEFQHANRTTGASGSFEVWWNSTLVATINSSGVEPLYKTYQFAAQAGNNTLRFRGTGTVDAVGASLDNVQLYATTTPVGGGNMDINQIVPNLTAGQQVQLQYNHANRTSSASGGFEVWWNGALVQTITSTGTAMQTKIHNLTAIAGNNTLRFRGIGTVDAVGASIDNVRLYATYVDVGGGNMDISQVVPNLAAGQPLQLQFNHANRTTSASGSFEVWWNGALLDTVTSTGTAMQTRSYNVTAVAGNNTLRFKGTGTVDANGASLDNVRLFATQGSGAPGSLGAKLVDLRPTAPNANDAWTWNVYDAAQRLIQTIDGTGATTVLSYDGASRLTSTRSYANRIDAGTLATLKAQALAPNLWANPNNGLLWSATNLNRTATGTSIGGAPAFQFSVAANAQWQAFSSGGQTIAAGDTMSFTISIKGVGAVTTQDLGIYGYANADWGANADGAAFIVSGPGSLVQLAGGFFRISGLSTSEATRITITRKVVQTETSQVYFYVNHSNWPAIVAGESAIVAAPVFARTRATVAALPVADTNNDRVVRSLYDRDGRLVGTLDGEGYLTETVYDRAGRQLKTIAYANITASTHWPAGTMDQLRSSAGTHANDIHQYSLHDARGLLRATVDGEGNVTRYRYTALGDLDQVVTGQKIDPATLLAYAVPSLANLPAAPGGTLLETTSYTRDLYGQVLTETKSLTGSTSTTTSYTYDNMRRLIAATTQSGGTDPRTVSQRYDRHGRLTGELSGIGSAALAALGGSPTQAQIDQVYATYGTTYVYDRADRMIARTDENGARTLFYYDADGRLAYQIEALGEIAEYRYDALGRRTDTIVYAARIAAGTLAGMTGGAVTASVTATVAALASALLDQSNHLDFNVDGTVKQLIDQLGYVTSFGYNAFGEPNLQTDPLQDTLVRQTSRSYDRRGLLKTEIVDSAGGGKAITTIHGYDAFGRAVQLTNPTNHVTGTAYDRAGRIISTTDALNNITGFAYDPRGNLVAVTDALNRVTRFVYDHAGRRTWVVDALGSVAKTSYDADGRVLTTTAYATAISLVGFGTQISETDVSSRVATHAKDRTTHSVYDKDGRVRFSVDAVAVLTEYVYDDAGNVIRTIVYGDEITPTANYTIAYVEGRIAAQGLAGLASTRTTRFVLDAVGRAAFAIDATGAVTASTFDSAGRIVKQRAFATLYTAAGNPSEAAMQSWAASNTLATDHVGRAVYDRKGQLAYSVDAEGYVTEYRYNKLGDMLKQVRYAAQYSVADGATPASMAAMIGSPAGAATTEFKYDSAGRLQEIVDPIGGRTFMTLDKAGRILTSTAAYGTADVSTTTWTYDALGRVETTRVQVDASTGNDLVTTNEYDALGNLVRVNDPRGFNTFYYYDALGRVTLQADAEKYVTKTTYNAFGEVDSILRYENWASNTPSVPVLPTVTPHAGDATTSFTYDRMGRVLSTTDALTYTESYAYDEFGNRISVTNKLLHTTTYGYDKLNRLISETLPVNAVKADQTVLATQVTNRFFRDSWGNVYSHVEAYGITEQQRTTSHFYDKLGRLIETRHDAVTVYGDNLLAGSPQTPTEYFAYDARGNLIRHVDAAGRKSFAWYDLADRKTDEVTAMQVEAGVTKGTLSHWTHDARGNIKTARVYGDLVTVPAQAGDPLPAPTVPSNYRETSFDYDRASRLLSSTVAGLTIGAFDGTNYAVTSNQSVSITRGYDRNGNVVRETDGAGNSQWTWYDKLGRRIAQVDREKYLTVWTLDSDGNATVETRYAKRVVGTVDQNTPATSLPGMAGTDPADRTTTFEYDRNGRRTKEIRLDVVASTVSANGALNEPGASLPDAEIQYTYNALGLVSSKREANTDLTEFEYDKIGRLTKTTGAAFTDHRNWTIRLVTDKSYDGLGNVVRTVEHGNVEDDAADRITTSSFGTGGRLTSTTDANGFTRSFGYDVGGRLVKEEYSRLDSTGGTIFEAIGYRYDLAGRLVTQSVATWNGSAYLFGSAARIRYNAFGEVSGRGVTGSPGDAAVHQEEMFYDQAGRLWKSSTGEGVVMIMLHDKAGNATLSLTSAGADFSGASQGANLSGYTAVGSVAATINSAGVTSIGNAITTLAQFDKRGQLIKQVEPGRQLGWNGASPIIATITSSRTHNAFGEVASETDPRGHATGNLAAYTTDYNYNSMGRLIEKKSPTVSWTSDTGVLASARPTETYFYDISGRLIGMRDANKQGSSLNSFTRILLAGTGHGDSEALVAAEFHPDAGVARTFYNVFGDARILRNELHNSTNVTYNAASDELRGYDNLGQVTQITHRGGLLLNTYVYDGLGRRTRHTNNLLGAGNVERTDYDVEGRVKLQVAFGGDETEIKYTWSSTIAAGALGTVGGWTRETTFENGRKLFEDSDIFGRLIAKTDLDQRVFTYGYDRAGRMTTQTVDGTVDETLTYRFYNSGRAASISNGAGNSTAYGYDVAGNLTSEWTQKAYAVVQDSTASYDALGRLTNWTEAGNATSPAASLVHEYDLAGNIRRSLSTYRRLDEFGTASGTVSTRDNWYLYDPMHRVVTEEGFLSGVDGQGQTVTGDAARGIGTIKRQVPGPLPSLSVDKGVGADYAYDASGRRVSMTVTKVRFQGGGFAPTAFFYEHKEMYDYGVDGYLSQTRLATGAEVIGTTTPPPQATGNGAVIATFARDAMGRVTRQTDWNTYLVTAHYDRYNIIYNAKGQVTNEEVAIRRGTDNFTNVVQNQYGEGAAYALGSVTQSTSTNKKNDIVESTATTTNSYVWWDGAAQGSTTIFTNFVQTSIPDTNYSTSYFYGPTGQLASVSIVDGRQRTVTLTTDMAGQILRRDEADNPFTHPGGDPHEVWYRFGGRQMGFTGNNGTVDTDYATSTGARVIPPGPGAFRFGSGDEIVYSDFSQALDPINSFSQGSAGGSYVVQAGDTLQSIAAGLWGNSSLWYLIAEANGLSAAGAIIEGQSLFIPIGGMSNAHNAETFKPYDAGKTLGDLSPTTPKAPKKANKCGGIGVLLVALVAVAVSIALPHLSPFFAKGAGLIIGGMISSAVSQGVGIAAGVQDKFSWKGVALAGITAGVGMGVGKLPGGIGTFMRADTLVSNVVKGAASSAISQGIGVATGLQQKFSWVGVAAAGVAAGVAGAIGRALSLKATIPGAPGPDGAPTADRTIRIPTLEGRVVGNAAGSIAAAATRSIITGTSFGDNILAVLPDIIASTIGAVAEHAIANGRAGGPDIVLDQNQVSDSARNALLTEGDLTDEQRSRLPNLPAANIRVADDPLFMEDGTTRVNALYNGQDIVIDPGLWTAAQRDSEAAAILFGAVLEEQSAAFAQAIGYEVQFEGRAIDTGAVFGGAALNSTIETMSSGRIEGLSFSVNGQNFSTRYTNLVDTLDFGFSLDRIRANLHDGSVSYEAPWSNSTRLPPWQIVRLQRPPPAGAGTRTWLGRIGGGLAALFGAKMAADQGVEEFRARQLAVMSYFQLDPNNRTDQAAAGAYITTYDSATANHPRHNVFAAEAVMWFARENPAGWENYSIRREPIASGIIAALTRDAVANPVNRRALSSVSPALTSYSRRARNILITQNATRGLQNWQAHHLIPVAEVYRLPINVQAAMARAGWRVDSLENLIAVPADRQTYLSPPNSTALPFHQGSHPNYSRDVQVRLLALSPMRNIRSILGNIENTMRGRLLDKRVGYHQRIN